MTIRAAVAQMDPHLGSVAENRERVLALLGEATANQAQLVVFPECAVTGYGFGDLATASQFAESIPGPSAEAIATFCAAHLLEQGGPYVVIGLLEQGPRAGILYNSAALLGPEGLIGVYRKAHLPLLGVDRFTTPGDTGFMVWETRIGRIGMLICYDLRFPEAMRTLALRKADIVALPTNWPDGSQNAPQFVTRTRALENRVYVLACNRCGEESGFRFFGNSQISDPGGRVLAEAGDQEALCYADFDPLLAREKRIILRPGEFELDTIGDRRPDLYTQLAR